MKTYKHLYPQIYAWENLTDAFYKARKGKRSRPDVAAFEFNLENEILSLGGLQTGSWLGSSQPNRPLPRAMW